MSNIDHDIDEFRKATSGLIKPIESAGAAASSRLTSASVCGDRMAACPHPVAAAVDLHIPLPPSANSIWRRSGTHMHKSTEYTAWLKEAGWTAKAQKPRAVHGPYKLQVQAVRPDKRRRDLDNLIKPISDLLTSIGVIDDDCYCEMLSMRWVTAGEGVHVTVSPAGVE